MAAADEEEDEETLIAELEEDDDDGATLMGLRLPQGDDDNGRTLIAMGGAQGPLRTMVEAPTPLMQVRLPQDDDSDDGQTLIAAHLPHLGPLPAPGALPKPRPQAYGPPPAPPAPAPAPPAQTAPRRHGSYDGARPADFVGVTRTLEMLKASQAIGVPTRPARTAPSVPPPAHSASVPTITLPLPQVAQVPAQPPPAPLPTQPPPALSAAPLHAAPLPAPPPLAGGGTPTFVIRYLLVCGVLTALGLLTLIYLEL